jgi:hypothetical protein
VPDFCAANSAYAESRYGAEGDIQIRKWLSLVHWLLKNL